MALVPRAFVLVFVWRMISAQTRGVCARENRFAFFRIMR